MRLPEFLPPSLQILWAEKGGDVYHAGNHQRHPQSYIERGYDRWRYQWASSEHYIPLYV